MLQELWLMISENPNQVEGVVLGVLTLSLVLLVGITLMFAGAFALQNGVDRLVKFIKK